MIRIGTVFSGIGAIEHALKRMNIEHKIVFACDNGDVDVLSKKINEDIEVVGVELSALEQIIKKINVVSDEDKLYKSELDKMLAKTEKEYHELKELLKVQEIQDIINDTILILEQASSSKDLTAKRKKEYILFESDLKNNESELNKKINTYKYVVQLVNDFKKDNDLYDLGRIDLEFKSKDNVDWKKISVKLKDLYAKVELCNGKKTIKKLKDICERTGMLHEKIKSFQILKELSKIEDYTQKKKYVDALYKGKEAQNKVKKSYMANYELSDEHFHWNVSFLDGKQYKDKVDLFVGGSPCQSFSLVGKQRGLEDTRGTLFYEFARLIKEIQPKVFIYENVKAILSNDDGKTWEKMKQVFSELGYQVNYKIGDKPSVLNAKDYGIPQNRERMFVVGFRNDIILEKEFSFPKPIPLEKKMQDFLLDNVSGRYYLTKKGVDFVTQEKNLIKRFTQIDGEVQLCQKKNQQFNWHGDFVFEEENKDKEKTMEELEKYFLSEKVRRYVLATGTKNFYSRPKTDLEIARPLLTTMHKMHRAGVDNYVTTDGRLRKLTPRECLRLMGFCDSFKIVVSDTAAYQQAGNSIVVDVLINIMHSIIESYPALILEK